MTDSQSNPYEAPSLPLKETAETPRGTRLRIIPVTIIAIYSGAGLLFSPALLLHFSNSPVEKGGGIVCVRMLGALLQTLGAIGLLYSA